uniref:hypothetical protein n=1 Tax=Periconia digitata TaxID=1303443 RepID=UPI0023AA952D|nr:hypothetical protein P1Q94_mgp28 [Periconia digitata]WCA44868.1 hypothetical protein [Periconia digitata]
MDLIKEKSSYISKHHEDYIESLDSSYKFYLGIGEQKNNFVLAISFIEGTSLNKIKFSLKGYIISRVKDLFSNDEIKRTSGSVTMTIIDDKLVKKEQLIKLQCIPRPRNKTANVEDRNIGTIDLETYTDKDGVVML